MKLNKLITILCAAGALAFIGIVTVLFVKGTESQVSSPKPSENSLQSSHIELEDAKEFALSDAGLKESEVTFSKVESDYDDGKTVYEIEFYKGQTEYEYEVDAVTGTVLEFKSELVD